MVSILVSILLKSDHDIGGIPGQWLDIVVYQDIRLGFWLANCEFGYGKFKKKEHAKSKDAYWIWLQCKQKTDERSSQIAFNQIQYKVAKFGAAFRLFFF